MQHSRNCIFVSIGEPDFFEFQIEGIAFWAGAMNNDAPEIIALPDPPGSRRWVECIRMRNRFRGLPG